MKRERISAIYADAASFTGREITVCGWARTIRDMKNFGFIALNDGSAHGNLQVVLERASLANYDEIARQNVGAALIVRGELVLTPEAKQPFELKAHSVEVEGAVHAGLPAAEEAPQRGVPAHDPAPQAAHEPLLRRVPREERRRRGDTRVLPAARLRLRAHADHHRFSDCEGAGEMFEVTTLDMANPPRNEDGSVDYSKDFFGKRANLTVSGQLNAENFAMAFGDVYTFGPTFRAENSNTQRHAAEFWMIEPEMAFADLTDYMDNAEAMIKYVINRVLERCPQEMEFFNSFVDKGLLERLHHVAESDFGRVTYTEAVSLLEKYNDRFDYKVFWGCDLQTEHERCLTEEIFKRPLFVTDYPKEIKAFYMRMNDDGKTVAAADCLVPAIGELIGGSQREERLDVLEARMDELGLNRDDYWWYLDLRRYGSCRHAGYGMGFERLIMYLTGVSNIRDVLPHPRTVGSADF